jgi:uncharacterized membrane protein YqaE (UPF0057 family)
MMESGLIVVALLVAYFLPTLVAWRRGHGSVLAIGLVNTLLGWTLLGWFWAMIWSLTGNVRAAAR